MHALVVAGLLSCFSPGGTPPKPQSPAWRIEKSAPLEVRRKGVADFAGKIHLLGKIPKVVKEYGHPALQVFADGATVRNFAWRGSMEGLHVGSQPFNGSGMRSKHRPISVTLESLYCDDIGEDCVSIQPRARVKLRDSQFRGNWRLRKGEGNNPGLDKIVQIDGAEVLIENCTFFNGLTAIRGKANSRIIVRHCRFINCSTCVSGDGVDNPRPGQTYDNGRAGPCEILVENCEFWDCNEVARAFKGCSIRVKNAKLHRTWRVGWMSGGTVLD